MLTIICALAENGGIGFRNRLLYPLREDLLRFKRLTTGNTIIMGRRTFESLPKGALPNRRNIVISQTVSDPWNNTEIYPSLSAALEACREEQEIFVIGGAKVYAEALPLADRLCLTHIHATPAEADTFFPPIDFKEWECVFKEKHLADALNEHAFTFADYLRK